MNVLTIDEKWINNLIISIQNNSNPELLKIELKQKWWVNDSTGQEEFLKDIVAMANTLGDKNGYIIIGLNEKGKLFNQEIETEVIDSFKNLVYKKIYFPYFDFIIEKLDINNNLIWIVEVFKNNDKPHIIKKYRNNKNFIPIRKLNRKGPGIESATKEDLDNIYYEKMDKRPINRLDIFIPDIKIVSNKDNFKIKSIIRNIGQNVNCISSCNLISNNNNRIFEIETISKMMNIKETILLGNDIQKVKNNDILRVVLGTKLENNHFFNNYINESLFLWHVEFFDFENNKYVSNEFTINQQTYGKNV